ncbi:N-acyl homoserine lactonase family protein [Arthrobacter sp. NPDC056886]|uniref:N-acyl homoserine lactonase family protein n=1 Tax=Arthrobacter sp. NPDC056886 TaxID=3345960 RepID=UPI003671B62E
MSTGAVEIRRQHVEADGSPLLWWLLTARGWSRPRPINVYVIHHEQGLVLFDTGQDRASVTDSSYFPRGLPGFLYRRLARFKIDEQETLTRLLADIGCDIAAVRWAVLSHLHQDHIGGLRELRHAQIIASAAEWASLNRPDAAVQGLMRRHIDLPGLSWKLLEFPVGQGEPLGPFSSTHDLFGDGSLVLIPTPGHTPGSVSLLVRRAGKPPLLMVGDVTYEEDLLRRGRIPGIGKRKALLDTTRAINTLLAIHPDLVILPAHDPGAADRLAAAGWAAQIR